MIVNPTKFMVVLNILKKMYIESHKIKKTEAEKSQKIEKMFSRTDEPEEKLLSIPRDTLISEHSKDVLAHWQAPEFEMYERDNKWYLYITLILLAIVVYAIYSNSPVMAITFILIGVVGYIYINKEPRVLDFMITTDGILAGKEIYEFDSLNSFWIFYEPDEPQIISLHTKSHLVPYVHIPIGQEDPVRLREIILDYIPEKKQKPGLLETLERIIGI